MLWLREGGSCYCIVIACVPFFIVLKLLSIIIVSKHYMIQYSFIAHDSCTCYNQSFMESSNNFLVHFVPLYPIDHTKLKLSIVQFYLGMMKWIKLNKKFRRSQADNGLPIKSKLIILNAVEEKNKQVRFQCWWSCNSMDAICICPPLPNPNNIIISRYGCTDIWYITLV